jgi:ABC-type Fe3+ transport system permease subunit
VGWPLLTFGAVLVVVLLCVATVYFVRQLWALRRLRGSPDLPDDERTYQRQQARRRLAGSLLMFLLCALLAGYLVFLETPAQQLAEQRAAARAAGPEPPLTPAENLIARFFAGFWIFFLLVLLAVVVLAALDLWATRRYAVRERQKIRDERRAMVAEELERLRRERDDYDYN